MKIIPFFLTMWCLLGGVSAEESKKSDTPVLFDASSLDKETLKKLPRLGMTYSKLEVLWGKSQKSDVEDGTRQKTDKEHCTTLTFSYVDEDMYSLPLTDAVKIVEALLPGFTFSNDEIKVSGKLWFRTNDAGKTYSLTIKRDGVYELRFSSPLKFPFPEKKIDTDKL